MNFAWSFKSFSTNILRDVQYDLKNKTEKMDNENNTLQEEIREEADRISKLIEAHKSTINGMG